MSAFAPLAPPFPPAAAGALASVEAMRLVAMVTGVITDANALADSSVRDAAEAAVKTNVQASALMFNHIR